MVFDGGHRMNVMMVIQRTMMAALIAELIQDGNAQEEARQDPTSVSKFPR